MKNDDLRPELARKLFGETRVRRVHFVGIGGAGMSALAHLLLDQRFEVSGSDLARSRATVRLKRRGADVGEGHRARRAEGADRVVYSSAVAPDNPELEYARKHGIPVLHRSELLAALMRLKRGIAVAGSHGKTSTSAMIVRVFHAAGLHPAYAVGGETIGLSANGAWGRGNFMVAEADESDASFHRLAPIWEVITNLDLDHVNRYPTWAEMISAFRTFIAGLRPGGGLVAWDDDARLKAIVPDGVKTVSFGTLKGALVRASEVELSGGGSAFTVRRAGKMLGRVRLRLLGFHSVLNALAAVAMGLEAGIDFPVIATALGRFRGVRRRLEVKAGPRPVLVVEDYSHHPEEVRAALAAVRTAAPRRLWCVFQPHRFSRLKRFAGELADALTAADRVIVADCYPAFETPLPGVSSGLLMDELRSRGHRASRWLKTGEIVEAVRSGVREGDAVVVMGAGDIGRLAGIFARWWKK